jgi:hypothetical protein
MVCGYPCKVSVRLFRGFRLHRLRHLHLLHLLRLLRSQLARGLATEVRRPNARLSCHQAAASWRKRLTGKRISSKCLYLGPAGGTGGSDATSSSNSSSNSSSSSSSSRRRRNGGWRRDGSSRRRSHGGNLNREDVSASTGEECTTGLRFRRFAVCDTIAANAYVHTLFRFRSWTYPTAWMLWLLEPFGLVRIFGLKHKTCTRGSGIVSRNRTQLRHV